MYCEYISLSFQQHAHKAQGHFISRWMIFVWLEMIYVFKFDNFLPCALKLKPFCSNLFKRIEHSFSLKLANIYLNRLLIVDDFVSNKRRKLFLHFHLNFTLFASWCIMKSWIIENEKDIFHFFKINFNREKSPRMMLTIIPSHFQVCLRNV